MPRVTSIYDRMPFGVYQGVPLPVIFHQDPGYFRWCIENVDDFCIQEWEYLKGLPTRHKDYIHQEAKYEVGQAVFYMLIKEYSVEEILVFLGGYTKENNPYVNHHNERKLEKFGIKPTTPKLFDRTYISTWWTDFPKLEGIWEFEGYERTSMGLALIKLKQTEFSQTNRTMINHKVGLVSGLETLILFRNWKTLKTLPQTLFQPGELVKLSTIWKIGQDEKYIISKIRY